MKILVLSDSHSTLRFMYACMDAVKPDAVVHLGDHYDDGEVLRQDYPGVRFCQVPGNCDRYRCDPRLPEILIEIGTVFTRFKICRITCIIYLIFSGLRNLDEILSDRLLYT